MSWDAGLLHRWSGFDSSQGGNVGQCFHKPQPHPHQGVKLAPALCGRKGDGHQPCMGCRMTPDLITKRWWLTWEVQEVEGNRFACFVPKCLPALLSDDTAKMVDEEGVVLIKFHDNCQYSFLMTEMCYKPISCCSPNQTVSYGKIWNVCVFKESPY